MNIFSWNVNSIGARLPIVVDWLQANQPDVVCLQEIKTTADRFPYEAFRELGYEIALLGQKSYNGVAILSKHPLEDVRVGLGLDVPLGQSRLIGATICGIQVINVYIPNGNAVGSEKFAYKLAWLAHLEQLLSEHYNPANPVLLCGDFNICPADLDVFDVKAMTGEIGFHPEERAALEKIRAWGLLDTFRQQHPTTQAFSWWDYRGGSFRRNRGLRIDHIWVTAPLASQVTRAWIDPAPRSLERPSDHTPVGVSFEILSAP
jgi:exodeoxyribonuclease III